MVWTKSATTIHRAASDANTNSGSARNKGHSKCRSESFDFHSTSHGNPASTNTAAGISECRAQGCAGDY